MSMLFRWLPDFVVIFHVAFILFVALPALFFRILSKTPLEQLAQIDFVTATTIATASAFTIALVIGLLLGRGILRLPATQEEALDALAADQMLTTALGPTLTTSYLAVRRSEWAAYSAGDAAFEQQGHFEKY